MIALHDEKMFKSREENDSGLIREILSYPLQLIWPTELVSEDEL
jgi:hypothetical protein